MKILIVDDNSDYLLLLSEFLERRLQIRPSTAASGQSALEALRLDEYDVVICDYEMPAMTGFELFERMVTEKFTTPFLLYTNRDLANLPVFTGSTFLGVVRKPNMDKLLDHLDRVKSKLST